MAPPRKQVIQFEAKDIDIRGKVLSRLSADLADKTLATNKFSSHIKNHCDLHGKGSHIKGSGPNHLKSSEKKFIDLADPEIDRFIDAIATRVEKRLGKG